MNQCDNIYYVYEYIRLDTLETFYVGKGSNKRAFDINKTSRSKHFNRIVSTVDVAVVILYDNLSEKDAFKLERDVIEDYVFTYGYGCNCNGHKCIHNEPYLVNCSFGGEGQSGFKHSYESKLKMSENSKGERNSNYKKEFSKSTLDKLSKNHANVEGVNNPFFGKHHTEDAKRKISNANKGRIGSWSGKSISDEMKINLRNLRIKECRWHGKDSPTAKSIKIIFPNMDEFKFDTIHDGNLFLNTICEVNGNKLIRELLKSNSEYSPRYKRLQKLKGIRVELIEWNDIVEEMREIYKKDWHDEYIELYNNAYNESLNKIENIDEDWVTNTWSIVDLEGLYKKSNMTIDDFYEDIYKINKHYDFNKYVFISNYYKQNLQMQVKASTMMEEC